MNMNQILQRGGGLALDAARLPDRLGRRILSEAAGIVQAARQTQKTPKPEMDDVTLARKVESEIFRGTRIAKANVNVNVVDGVVWLRGELKRPEQIRRLEQKALAVPEVRGVENLLHLAKTPAPTRADTPKRQQRTRSSTRQPAARRTSGRVSDDRSDALVAEREQSPVERAQRHEGRTPAPFGSSDTTTSSTDEPTSSSDTTTSLTETPAIDTSAGDGSAVAESPSVGDGPGAAPPSVGDGPGAAPDTPAGAMPERPALPARAASAHAADSDS
jgi:hypothetical protein